MWQRFTERAKKVVFFAQEEAGRLGENYVSTEHLLLALARVEDCTAARILSRMGVSWAEVRSESERLLTRGEGTPGADMQLAPRAKRVIDLAYDEARRLDNNYIGTEHILLGIVREGEGLAGKVLDKLGVGLEETRRLVAEFQSAASGASSPPAEASSSASSEKPPVDMADDSVSARTRMGRVYRFGEGNLAAAMRNKDAAAGLAGKDLVEIACLSRAEIDAIFEAAQLLKTSWSPERQRAILHGKTLAMIFEKPSLRTRVTFETGIFQLGGHGIYLQPSDIQLGVRETIADAARNLTRWVDIIMARTFKHETVTELAEFADVPVINGLSDLEHPCQALADFFTILEKKHTLTGVKLAFIGDGNNVAHSLMLLAAKVGSNFVIACPEGYEPAEQVVTRAREFAKESGASVEVVRDPAEAAAGADAVYTDVWASMGQESEAAERAKVFACYQVNSALMARAKPDAIFEHCLPAHRGQEVTDEVLDGPQSVVIDEAENRLHVQKAVMALVAG